MQTLGAGYSVLIGGLPLFSSPGLVAGAGKLGLFSVRGAVPAGGLFGTVTFDPDGSAESPLEDGSGVSAAKATALIVMAATSKLETRNIIFLLPIELAVTLLLLPD